MARGASITVENSFTRGLITEFTAMNFPEQAVTEGDNCVFRETGQVERRLGLDFEDGYLVRDLAALKSSPVTGEEALTEFRWFAVGEEGTESFLVQQIGNVLRIFYVGPNGSMAFKAGGFFNLMDHATPGTLQEQVEKLPCQFTTGNGLLFVAHPLCQPFFIRYNNQTETFTKTEISVEIRDLQGLQENVPVDERPATLTPIHEYNLLNQGWYHIYNDSTVLDLWLANPVTDGLAPSNADIWWLFKDSNENFQPNRQDKFTLGNTPAPKGHYIYDAFNIDRSAETGIDGLQTKTSGRARPTAVVWYAGRVWYGGTRSPEYSNTLYFSQIVERDDQIGACYQANDPTSETVFDLLDTDGGTLSLPLLEEVVALKVLGETLIVFGTNGIYAIGGTDNGPFRATSYTVRYVSAVGATSHLSMVEAEGAYLWFNYDGIYAINPDQVGLSFTVNSVSKQTIQSFFEDIPINNLPYVKGGYNKRLQTVRWIFSDQEDLTFYKYNRMLDLNVVSKAFFPHTISTETAPRVSGIIPLIGQLEEIELEDIETLSGEDIFDLLGNQIQTEESVFRPNQEVFKFTITGDIASGAPGLTFGEMNDTRNRDFVSYDNVGVPYVSRGVSGYRIRGELLRDFTSTPILFVVENKEGGRAEVRAIFDYGFRRSQFQELYLTRPEVDYILRRVKLRGKGKSMQIEFQSVGDAPFTLIGWSTFDTGGTLP